MFGTDETSGLLGTLFGVAVCGVLIMGALSTVSVPGCKQKPDPTIRMTAKRDMLKERHALLSSAMHSRDKDFVEVGAAIDEAKRLLAERNVKLPKLKEDYSAAERSYYTTRNVFVEYQQRYRESIRVKAAGVSLGSLRVRSGVVYQDVVIQCVTDAGLEIRHSTGKARIAPDDLPEAIQNRFQWDPEKNEEYRAREESQAKAFEAEVMRKQAVSARSNSLRSASAAVSRLSLLRYQIYKTRSAYNEALAKTHLIRGTRFASRRLGDWENQAHQLSGETAAMLRELEQLELDLTTLESNLQLESDQ